MAIKISDMEPYGNNISDNDMFEMVAQNELKSYRVSAQNIANYCKLVNNGAFRGKTEKALNDFTYEDTGVWLWGGASPFSFPDITQAYVEIICYYKPGDQTVTNLIFIQRLSAGTYVYQRIRSGNSWGDWASLTNRNGNRILYGDAKSDGNGQAIINFSPYFSKVPCLVVTPHVNTSEFIYYPQVTSVTTMNASVIVYKSSVKTVVTSETSSTTETKTDTTTTKKTETKVSLDQGGWTVAEGVTLNWIATLEEG